jgi:hypothetical protein
VTIGEGKMNKEEGKMKNTMVCKYAIYRVSEEDQLV